MKFSPPPKSREAVARIDFGQMEPVAPENLALYNAADRGRRARDPSNAILGKFPNGTIFICAKLAIDADGQRAGPGYLSGRDMDPEDGQDEVSWRFPNGTSLSSEKHPFYVLPGAHFGQRTGLALGDLCAVIYGNVITGAIFGDAGPETAIGEGSIRLHMNLMPEAPDPCSRREGGRCQRARQSSIEARRDPEMNYHQGVLCFGFPGTKLDGLTWDNFEERVKAAAYPLLARLRTV